MVSTLRVYVLSNELGPGGVPQVIYNVCTHLRDTDIDVRIGYLGGNDETVGRLRRLGYTVEKLGEGFPGLGQPAAVYRAIAEYGPDVVHTHMAPASLLGRPIGTLLDAAVVSTVHNIYTEHSVFAKLMDYPTSHLCDAVVAVSNAVLETLPRTYGLGAEKTVIHNCIDVGSVREKGAVPLDEVPWSEKLSDGGPIIANVARFSKKKGQHDLVTALPSVVDRFPDAQLLMTGWGPMKEELEDRAVELGVRENTVFLEKVDNPYAVYYNADVIAFPSRFEGFSIGLLEAMAFGKPIVATDISPFVEALGDGYPVVSVGEPSALAERTVAFLSDPESSREFGSTLRTRVDEQFSGDAAARGHADLYRRLASD
jgi:glycosyltransferase involved in cell wall biosynthesis